MNQIWLVMSEELLDHEELEKTPCRAFATKDEAEQFRKELKQLYLENADYENETTFWVQPLDFGRFGR